MTSKVLYIILAAVLTASCGDSHPSGGSPADKPWILVNSLGGGGYFVYIKESHWQDENVYRQAASELCQPNRFCSISFWKDRSMIPEKYPLTKAQRDARIPVAAHYTRDGEIIVRWGCGILKQPEKCPPGVKLD